MTDELTVTNRARYAVSAMIEIARAEKPVALHTVATATNISLSYLEQLIAALRKHELVTAQSGRYGGYIIAKLPAAITIADIIRASDDFAPGNKKPQYTNNLPTPSNSGHLWSHLNGIILQQLQHITLEDVIIGNLESVNHLF